MVERRVLFISLIGIGAAGILLRYGAYYFETGDLSLSAYVDALCQWDCRLYNLLAQNGYERSANPDGGANWAFFPFFPLVLFSFHSITGLSLTVGGALLSQRCIVAAAACARPLFKNDISTYWVFCALLITGPLSFYYSASLTEALFVLLTVIALVSLYRGNYLAAGVGRRLAFGDTRHRHLHRAVQIVDDCRRGTLPIGPATVALLLAPIGLLAFMMYLYVYVGDTLAFARVQVAWGRSLHSPLLWSARGLRRGPSSLGFWLIVTAIGAFTICVVMALRGDFGAALFCAASLTLSVSTGPDFMQGLSPVLRH